MLISWGNHQHRGIKVSANDLNLSRDFRSELAVEVGKTSSVANDHFFGDSQPNKLAKAFSCGVDNVVFFLWRGGEARAVSRVKFQLSLVQFDLP